MKLLQLILVAISLGVPSTAAAHTKTQPLKARSLTERVKLQRRTIRHDLRVLRRTAWLDHYGPWAKINLFPAAWQARRLHASEVRWMQHKLRVTLAALRARSTVGHLAGWLCIHGSEGAWDSQTGNGFYGGLQMTYGWMGLVSNAALLSPTQQMRAADRGLMAQPPSRRDSWMRGQWPNTYPPCSHLF